MEQYLTLENSLVKWTRTLVDYLPRLFLALVVFLIFVYLGKFFRKHSKILVKRISNGRAEFSKLLSSIIYGAFVVSGLFIALEILKLEGVLTKLIAGAGVIGIIAGFAFKDIASNAFAGLLVNAQRPFKEGDWVTVKNHFGKIHTIGWITTSIKTIEGEEAIIPNQLLYNNTMLNHSSFGKRRVIFSSGVSYGDDLEHVKKVALEEVKSINGILPHESIEFYFTEIGSSTYNFVLRFWIKYTDHADFLNAQSETIMRIKKRFEQEDISLAYSVLSLDFGVKGGVNAFDKTIQIAQENK